MVEARPGDEEALLDSLIRELVKASKSIATRRAYVSDWKHFSHWCKVRDKTALPAEPETVARYLAAHSGSLKVSTLTRRLASIAQIHRSGGHPDPPTRHSSVREVMKGIRRQYGTATTRKSPILVEDLKQMVATCPDTLLGKRNRALLLVGFAGAFRRAELVALDVRDVQFARAGMVITIRRSKTDQDGTGAHIAIPNGQHEETCPVKALRAWLTAAQIKQGAIFRRVDRHGRVFGRASGEAVAIVVRRAAEEAGFEDTSVFAGHSLRAGLATVAAIAGAPARKIMAQTRHKSRAMLDRYIRDAEMWKENAAEFTGI